MKKMILAAFVAVASLSANAQVWVGGELGLGTSKTTVKGNEQNKENWAEIIPEVGYTLNDNWDIAVAIGYKHNDVKNGKSQNAFVLNPYARYTFVKAGDFSFFLDGGFSYENSKVSGDKNKTNTWEIAIKPGISYAVSDKVTLVAHVGGIAYDFEKYGNKKTNTFNLGLNGNGLTFGAYVNF